MSFDQKTFLAEPSQEKFNLAKKSDLLNLASHYQLPEVKSSMRKQEVKNILTQYLINEEIFDESALYLIVESHSDSKLRELEIKLKLEEMQDRKLEREREERQLERKRERQKEERQWQIEREKEERQLEREKEDRQLEREKEERQLEREKLEFQIKMRELEVRERVNQIESRKSSHFDVTKNIRLVPPFQEKEVDKYFLHFEKVAVNLKWPREHWTLLLQTVLIGKAREIYTQLTVEQSSSYDTVKELILKGYELVPEAYR